MTLMVFVSLLFANGCTLTHDYVKPSVKLPSGWMVEDQTAEMASNVKWWTQFDDPVLDEMIETALLENRDLRIAAAQIEEYAARLQSDEAGFYPKINYGVSASRYQNTKELERTFDYGERTQSSYSSMLDVSWEIDFWGRIRRSTEAARADLLSSEAGAQAVALTLVSALSAGYFDLLSLDKQLQVTRETLSVRKKWLDLFEKKKEGGQISGLELAQAKSEYVKMLTHVPALEIQIAVRENALSVLLGHNPGAIKRGKTLDRIADITIPSGLPADLLIRRPDIRQSEQQLIAANARIGVARTRYFPDISLTGLLGYVSAELSDLVRNSAGVWGIGADLYGPIFSGGKIKGDISQAEARYEQLLSNYLKTIQTAFQEVEDSLISIQKLKELLKVEASYITVLNDTVTFARDRYDAGYSRYLEVKIAERELYDAQIKHVKTQSDYLTALVDSYKAFGGGWESSDLH